MSRIASGSITRITRVALVTGAGLTGALVLASSASAGSPCFDVSGRYAEQAAAGTDCTSPVGLCITGQYTGGDLKGTFFGAAQTITPTADTPATAVLLFTTDSTTTGKVRGRSGTLAIRNAGAFRTAGEGSIVDLQTIVGGTGQLAGASGEIRASGTFSQDAGGTSSYAGTICLP
jgi:hypothetical protein